MRGGARGNHPPGAEPPFRNLLVAGFPDVFDAADAVPLVLEHGVIGLEGLDNQLVNDIRAKGVNTGQLKILPKGAAGCSPSSVATPRPRPTSRPGG